MARVRTVGAGQFVDWDRAVQLFLLEKEAQGRAAVTLAGYRDVLRLFHKRFPEAWPDGVKEAAWSFLAENGISASTYNHRLNSLRQFFAFCAEQGWLPENPLAKFKAKRKESRARLIDVETLRALLKQPNRKTFTGLRDYALILLTLDTGIRPSEARRLVPADFNLPAREVRIPATASKTGYPRTLPMLPVTVEAIRKLLAARHPDWGPNVPVFCNWEGKPLTRSGWLQRIELLPQGHRPAHVAPL